MARRRGTSAGSTDPGRTVFGREARGSSKAVRATRRFLRRSWSALLVLALTIGLGIAAVAHPGVKAADLHLDEAQVYVQKESSSLLGTINMPSEELANASVVGARTFELLQQGSTVLVRSGESNALSQYDAAQNQLSAPTNLPKSALVSMNAGQLAVNDPTNGRVWFGEIDQMLKTDFQLVPAALEIGQDGLAVVTTDGGLLALNVQTSQVVRLVGGTPSLTNLPFKLDPQNAGSIELSAVGDKAVVLDRATQRIWVEGEDDVWEVDSGSNAMLPPPSASAAGAIEGARAVYATPAGLVAVTKDGPRSLTGLVNASPARPLIVGDCVYGAFGNKFAKRCAGGQASIVDIPEVPADAELRFATNRGAVVLNDVTSGYVWLVDQGMKLIKDWSKVTPQEKDNPQQNNSKNEVVNPNRKKPNQAPKAVDDKNLAAREGRSTVLTVLDNDYDPDGDILTIQGTPNAKGVTFQRIRNGSGLQVTVPEGAKGRIEFDYTIADGRGGTDTAHGSITILPADQTASNRPPEHRRPDEKLLLSQRAKGSKQVLVDWRDPDGDDLILVKAEVEGEDEVTFTSDGNITFQDVGKTTGTKKVKLTVSDGVSRTTSHLLVEVVKGGAAAPVANGDFYTTAVGAETVLSPLLNDQGGNLTLRDVVPEGDAAKHVKVSPNYHEGTIQFTADQSGTYYLSYTVSNGPVSVGIIRVDVLGKSKGNSRPVAARDVVLLPPGGSVLVDPLANDFDADGDVMVIQSVDVPSDLKVTMQERHLLTVSAWKTPEKPLTLKYWISDGTNSTPGTIVVIPTDAGGSQVPEANVDEVRARAGAIISVPVLKNDRSPIGLDLSVRRVVEAPSGSAWVDGDRVRVQVPSASASASMSVTYEVVDADGRTASSIVNITIVSADAQNLAPNPPTVEARVLQGTTTRILIPLDGIDPNGDPVRLMGLGSGPEKGRVMQVGEKFLSYEAFPTSEGTDVFRYTVVDAQGMEATGEVRIGIAPQLGGNTPPTTVDDTIRVKPGAQVTLPLLLNDYDVDGDSIGFADKDPIDLPVPYKLVNGNAISFTAPTKEGNYAGRYYVRDSARTEGNGTITLVVDADAPPLAPVAGDDLVAVSEVTDKEYIDVKVLKNDYDLDGPSSALKVSVPAGQQDVSTDGVRVRAKVGDVARQVRYTITDADGRQATAVVTIPGRDDQRPLAKERKAITVTAGERFVIDLNQYVSGTRGRPVQLTSVDTVRATNGAMIPSLTKLEWTPSANYVGPAAIVFEVVDRVPADDKTAKRAYITLAFTVKPPPNASKDPNKNKQLVQLPPELYKNQAVLQVGAGEGESRVDLRTFYRDPNGDEIRFQKWRVDGGAEGIKWRAEGDQQTLIYAQAEVTAKPGTTLRLVGTVLDIHGNNRPASLTITVVPSTRPRPTAATDLVKEANAGRPSSVPVLQNDKSHLLKDTSLNLLSARVVSGGGSAKVEGQNVIVTPAENFVGDMTVEYTIVDATKDPNRQSTGRIVLTVRSKPGNPGVPREVKSGDGYVTLQWTDGALNGLPVKSRTLSISRADQGGTTGKSVQCETNTCTINGLKNGKKYWFKVTQTNELGQAESAESAPSKPDVVPEVMGRPEVAFGQNKLKISWAPGVSRGSPILEYRVTMHSGGRADPIIVPANKTSTEFTGLTNDVQYTFTVAARNEVGWSKEESPASLPEHPSGPPEAPTNVVAADTGKREGGELKISWKAAEYKLDKIEKYLVYAQVGSGSPELVGETESTSILFAQAKNEVAYTFTVASKNRLSVGPKSTPSQPTKTFGAPPAPVGAGLTAGDGTLTFSSEPNNTPTATAYELEVIDADQDRVALSRRRVQPGQQLPGDYVNGRKYYARVWAINVDKTSEPGGTRSVMPIGRPGAPSVPEVQAISKSDGRVQVYAWFSKKDLQGNDPSTVRIEYRVGNGGWTSLGPVTNHAEASSGWEIPFKLTVNDQNAELYLRAVGPTGASPQETKELIKPPLAFVYDAATKTLTLRVANLPPSTTCTIQPPFDKTQWVPGTEGAITKKYDGPAELPATFTAEATCSLGGNRYHWSKQLP